MKPLRVQTPEEVAAAKELYMVHGPGNRSLVVREMRESGWSQFVHADLDGRPWRGFAGLVELYGWREEWKLKQEAAAEEEGEKGSAGDGESPSAQSADFPSWLEASNPKWDWRRKFQRVIYGKLERITSGKDRRLMIFMPPRHGKSELVTVRYAAWRLIREPGLRIVIGSYNQRLANRFSRYIKAVYCHGPRFVLPQSDESEDASQLVLNAMDEWETAAGGGVKAVGVGAGITGFGADLVIIDDPVKSRAEAESKNNRERVWEWFTDDLMTRLEPRGAVILIQTRWHEDDLAGRLLAARQETGDKRQETGDKGRKKSEWSVVSFAAIAEAAEEDDAERARRRDAEIPIPASLRPGVPASIRRSRDALRRRPGEALWPQRFSAAALLARKAEMGSYSFAALYQQRPMPADGGLFKREWFSRVVPFAPSGLRWYRGYDLAVSTKTSADYTASFRVALDKKTGDLYIADGFRARVEFPDQRKYIVGRIRDERDTEHGIEEALHGQAFVQDLWREEKLRSSAFRGVRVSIDKFTRALAWANRAEAGKVVLVSGAWIEAFLDEVTHFPNAAHDDQVDAVSLAVQMIETRKNQLWVF